MSREDDAILHLGWARAADKDGDYPRARMEYFKCVESWRQANKDGEFKNEFQEATNEYQSFALRDPLYNKILNQIIPVIQSNQGILQKDIYNLIPSAGREDISYVLYFAHSSGSIVRNKKGRTYELFIK